MPALTQSSVGVPSTQERTWSMAALAADAAEDAPRASMIAAPRLATVGMNVSRQPLPVDLLGDRLAADLGVEQVGVLARGVVAPDRHPAARRTPGRPSFVGHLGQRPVVVQPHHRAEPVGRDVRRVRAGDQRVGVGRVADHQHPDVVGGDGVDRLALRLEDAAVGLQQVGRAPCPGPRGRAPTSSADRACRRTPAADRR